MFSFSLKCRKHTESKNSKVVKTKNGRIMHSSKSAVCGSKKLRFMKEQDDSGLLSGLLGLKLSFEGAPTLGNII